MDVSKFRSQIRRGLVEYCLLSVVKARGQAYGLELIESLAHAGLSISEGTLYPLMSRLVREKILNPKWVTESSTGHPRKYYELTPQGREFLNTMSGEWDQLNDTILKLRGMKNGPKAKEKIE